MDTVLKNITYGQLKENKWLTDNDRYGLAAFVDDNIRETFLESPFNVKSEKTAILLAVDGTDIVGRHLLYGTKIKVGDSTVEAQSSGSTEVDESQRGKGIGSRINKWTLNNEEYPVYICSLLTASCLSIMRKPENECVIFDFPRFSKIINIKTTFVNRGLKGGMLWLCTTLGNVAISCMNFPNKIKLSRLKKRYKIKKEDHVPIWAGELCLNDGHKYAEYHDVSWLEWNLKHNLSGSSEDKQSIYGIYDGNDMPVGFFFTKERLQKGDRIGTLCEWATDSRDLRESDINLLALSTFSKNCHSFRTITDNPVTAKKLKKMGFLRLGSMQMGFKDKLHQFPDMADQSNWRIRFGCCNSILY